MSFTDWYHADRKSPNAQSAGQAGMQTGMMIGSLFGPVGTGIGAVVGGAFGGLFGSNAARKRARVKATKEAYAFGEDLFKYSAESTTQINTDFERNLSMLNARAAGSGGNIDDTLAVQKGKLIQERDTELSILNEEVDIFRQGPNYEWLRKDYERVAGLKTQMSGSQKGDGKTISYSIGGETRSNRAIEAYTPEQKQKLATYTAGEGNDYGGIKAYKTYADMVKPSMEMYEKLVFGDKTQKQEYQTYMDSRIETANAWLEKQQAVITAREKVAEERRRLDSMERGAN